MIKVLESQTIVQRHINSFFFRQFICENGTGIPANISVHEFMTNIYEQFIEFLEEKSTDVEMQQEFHSVFGDKRFTIDVTRQCISAIHDKYSAVINELEEVFMKYEKDEKRKIAISNQIRKCKDELLLNYLSTNQFLPNANMPTDVVTFDFTDGDQAEKLFNLYKDVDNLHDQKRRTQSPSEILSIELDISKKRQKINEEKRSTTASRDIHTALNEYAPGQTVVVNEKNYVSAGILLFGAYNESTQTKAIYHCTHCGYTEYSDNLDETKVCPVCKAPYHGIVDPDHSSYTRAYEPIGFRTDQSKRGTREEKTEKTYYDIRPVLLNTDWSHAAKLNMCEVISSGDNGSILFYNVGSGNGFAFCKRCGRAAIESSKYDEKTLPLTIKPGHKPLWRADNPCDANSNDIARHVVFTGRHQTCYSVLRFKRDSDSKDYENDEQLAFSLGVIITRTLAKSAGIDESEIGFGVKQEQDSWVLFIYDTAKGGCGYSLRLSDPTICQEILALAKAELENSPCDCEERGGACAKCLIDRNNFRYASKLSKGKALDWLSLQNKKTQDVPAEIIALSPSAKVSYQSLKSIAKEAITEQEVSSIIFCVSDIASDYSVNDWVSMKSEMGRLIKRAIENGKKVSLKIEYHSDFHRATVDKLPFIDLQTKMPDCEVAFISDMGNVKTAIIVETPDSIYHYFTAQENALSFSNNWGNNCEALYIDHEQPTFREITAPTYVATPKEILRSGFSPVTTFLVKNYFSDVIAPSVLKSDDLDVLMEILKHKNVEMTFSDLYVNSALASLMLVYLIEEMKTLFGFNIKNITLQLDSSRRNCKNERFNKYITHIDWNFDNKENADNYTDNLIKKVLGIEPKHSDTMADHHRWLKITTEDNDVVEIRPDHGISGGWKSDKLYQDLEHLDGTVRVFKKNEEVLYYIIINRNRE